MGQLRVNRVEESASIVHAVVCRIIQKELQQQSALHVLDDLWTMDLNFFCSRSPKRREAGDYPSPVSVRDRRRGSCAAIAPGSMTWKGRSRLDRRARGSAAADRTSEVARKVKRSEEHTSELQSLMRISHARFCL